MKKIILFFSFFLLTLHIGCEQKSQSISVSPENLFFPCNVNSLSFMLEGNINFNFYIKNIPEWLSVSPSSGENSNNYMLKASLIQENLFPSENSGSITIIAGKNEISISVSTEICAYGIEFSPESLTFGSSDFSKEIIIYTFSPEPLNWIAQSGAKWLSITPNSGTLEENFQTITVKAKRDNLSPGTYFSEITFYTSNTFTVLPVTLEKADYPILYFPETSFEVNDCSTSITVPYINIGEGNDFITYESESNILYSKNGWFEAPPGENYLEFKINRIGLYQGISPVSVTVTGNTTMEVLNFNVNVPSFDSDWFYIESITPQEGIVAYSSNLPITAEIKTYISSSSTGGNLYVQTFSFLGDLLSSIAKSVPSGVSSSVVEFQMSGLQSEDYPIYLQMHLESNSGKGTPEYIISYPAYPTGATYYTFLKEINLDNGGLLLPGKHTVKAKIDYSAPLTSEIGLWIFDEFRNLLGKSTFETMGNGITELSVEFETDNCTAFTVVEGRIYEITNSNLVARSSKVFKNINFFSDYPDYFEPATSGNPFPVTFVKGSTTVVGNFNTGDNSDFYTFSLTKDTDITIFTYSPSSFTNTYSLCLWDNTFSNVITCGIQRDPYGPDSITYYPSLSTGTYALSLTPNYSFRGSGTDYLLLVEKGKFETHINDFSITSDKEVATYSISITNQGNAEVKGLKTGLFLTSNCPPSSQEKPDFIDSADIESGYLKTITFTYPCQKNQYYTACAAIWGNKSSGGIEYSLPISFQCR